MSATALKKLKKAIKDAAAEDEFEVGTVIRWTASERYQYAAVKAGNGFWYTTAEFTNFVDKRLVYEELAMPCCMI